MSFIDLDRLFLRWSEKQNDAAEIYAWLRHSSRHDLDWTKLLQHRRVVILAEAGSGKTEELREHARRLSVNRQFGFYATVQDVARHGLEGALDNADRSRLQQWRVSDQPGWFFIDSIDEAKLVKIQLETALRKLKDRFEVAPRRAYLVLSGRLTDWEFRADLSRLGEILGVPPEASALPAPTPDTLLVQTLRGERREEPTEDKMSAPLVVLMAPLDVERVRRFATAKGVTALDAFMAGLEDGNLWSLASRPKDLEWLVAYWRLHQRFGPLAEVLATSINERLRETNPFHAQSDPITEDRALLAVERIGAAFVFGRREKLTIADSELSFERSSDWHPAHVLPDWSADHRGRLIMRPVFDPGTFGRVRLHNDNLGEVRSYLAARWLKRRRDQNAPVQGLLDLIFANSYGVSLIKPSLRQTAAWASIWDADVAREVLARDPLLLLTEGDPGSLSLGIRISALNRAVDEMRASGDRLVKFDQDTLRRFSTPDLAAEIRKLWNSHKANQEVRELLLRMIGLGSLTACADIAAEALFGSYTDRLTLVFAGRALAVTGDAAALARYAHKIKADAATLPARVLWEALDHLFPAVISLNELLAILGGMSEAVRDESLSMQIQGPKFAERLSTRADLEALLAGLLAQLGAGPQSPYAAESSIEKAYIPIVTETAHALLKLAGPNDAPPLAIDAALRVGERRRYRAASDENKDFLDALRSSPERRRAALWRAVGQFTGHPALHGQALLRATQLEIAGYSPGLKLTDVDWLLVDVRSRASESDRRMTLGILIELWAQNGRDDALLARIQAATADEPALAALVVSWLTPREPSAEEIESRAELARAQGEAEAARAEGDRSWQELIARLRADPGILARQPPPTPQRVDGHLFSLYELLRRNEERRNHYAIDDLRSVEPILGAELTAAFRDALVDFWRQWTPTLPSSRPPDQQNVVSNIDPMAICSVSVDAKQTSGWPAGLSAAEATKAAELGILEIGGFPVWFDKLAIAFPAEVRAILLTEIRAGIDTVWNGPHHGTLDDVEYASQTVARCVAEALLDLLITRTDIPPKALDSILTIISRGLNARQDEFADLALARLAEAQDLHLAALYFIAAFKFKPNVALAAFLTKLDALAPDGQTVLVQHALPGLFGDRMSGRESAVSEFPFEVLTRLVDIALRTIRIEEDTPRDDGQVFSPNDRDAAQNARNALFNRLYETPGRATFEYLHRLARQQGFPVPPDRLENLAFTRAANDAEHSSWQPGEAYAMETAFDSAPNTPLDLQQVALRRVFDMNYALHHDDFAQGRVFKALRPESSVQEWVADRLRLKEGRAYSVEREPQVVEGKMPDIRLQARATSASLPIEIKVAESWTLQELEDALTVQLGGRYLRAQDAHHGVLLVVHQKARPQGWRNAQGRLLTFPQVIAHLRRIADAAAAVAPDAPQARIGILDVSDIALSRPAKKKRRAKEARGSKRKAKRPAKANAPTKKSKKARTSKKSARPKGNAKAKAKAKKSGKRRRPAKPK
jgi:hypothetical protein